MDNRTQFLPSSQHAHQDEKRAETPMYKNQIDEIVQLLIQQTPEAIELIKQGFEATGKKLQFHDDLEYMPVDTAIEQWLNSESLSHETRKQYERYINDMKARGIIPDLNNEGKRYTLGELRRADQQKNIDHMSQIPEWAASTRQLRISCYVSLMKYLSSMSGGWFRSPRRIEYSAYYQAQHARIEKALTVVEWQQFIKALHAIDQRDALIARCLLRNSTLEPVLSLRLPQVNFGDCTIVFQKKYGKTVAVRYPAPFMQELKRYIDATAQNRTDSELVFVTRSGKKVVRSRCNYSFLKASKMVQIKRVTPFTMRASYITLIKGGKIDESLLFLVPESGT